MIFRFLFSLVFLSASGLALGSQLCNEAFLSGCSSLESDSCLRKFHACGKYREIVHHFSAELLTNSPEARYFKGISYYGLTLRNRAQTTKCEYRMMALQELEAFLGDAKSASLTDPEQYNRAYHAAKVIRDLDKMKGCFEQAYSPAQLEQFIRTYSRETLAKVFEPNSPDGSLGDIISTIKTTIKAILGQFVTEAATAEKESRLRKVAIEASLVRLDDVKKIFEDSFGDVTVTRDDTNELTDMDFVAKDSTKLSSAESKAATYHSNVESKKEAILKKMGNTSLASYEDSRTRIIRRAKMLEVQTSAHSELVGLLITSSTEYKNAKKAEEALKTSHQAEEAINRIYSQWNQTPSALFLCQFTTPKPWYCKS